MGHEDQWKSRGGARPEWMSDEGSRQFGGRRGGMVPWQEAGERKLFRITDLKHEQPATEVGTGAKTLGKSNRAEMDGKSTGQLKWNQPL